MRLTPKKKLTLNYTFKTFKLGYESSSEYFFDLKKYTSTSTQVPPFTIPKAGFTNKQIAGKYANCVQTKKCSLALKLQPYNTTRRNIHRRGKDGSRISFDCWQRGRFIERMKGGNIFLNGRSVRVDLASFAYPTLFLFSPPPASFTLSAC